MFSLMRTGISSLFAEPYNQLNANFATVPGNYAMNLRQLFLLNTNYATAYETQYSYTAANGGTWDNPTTILGPRFMRLNFTLNY